MLTAEQAFFILSDNPRILDLHIFILGKICQKTLIIKYINRIFAVGFVASELQFKWLQITFYYSNSHINLFNDSFMVFNELALIHPQCSIHMTC